MYTFSGAGRRPAKEIAMRSARFAIPHVVFGSVLLAPEAAPPLVYAPPPIRSHKPIVSWTGAESHFLDGGVRRITSAVDWADLWRRHHGEAISQPSGARMTGSVSGASD